MSIKTSLHTLPNGLRLVHVHTPGAAVAHTGVAVLAGSRNEASPDVYGLAHFVEHTIFKGTTRRSPWHIINRMEAVGGELNAFTTKEDTVIYSSFPKNALPRALDLIADLVLNSRFPSAELDKERYVICDEINSYLDSPADAVYDDFEDLLYAGSPLGHNILGTIDSVRRINSDDCRKWLQTYYTAPNMVAFYAGPAGPEQFLTRCLPYYGAFDSRKPAVDDTATTVAERFETERSVDLHQAHTVMGCSAGILPDNDRMALTLLTNILGGPGMNSMLNVDLRERRGLVYNVDSTISLWRDAYMFTTYFGTDTEDNDTCVQLVTDRIDRMAQTPMTARSLAAAKKQYLGQLILSRANAADLAIAMTRAMLLRSRAATPRQIADAIAALTPDDICRAAGRLTALSRLTMH